MTILHSSAAKKRLSVGAVVLFCMLVAAFSNSVKTAPTAHAAVKAATTATTAPPNGYYHSWYVDNPYTTDMQNLAFDDASWANSQCPTKYDQNLTVLDFGRPQELNSVYGVYNSAWPSKYGGYGA